MTQGNYEQHTHFAHNDLYSLSLFKFNRPFPAICACFVTLWKAHIRDWSLITGRGATKWENRRSETFLPPSRQGKNFRAPLLMNGNFLTPPPFNMAKTSSYRIKTTPKLVVPPIQHGYKLLRPPFNRGKTSHAPLPFCSPPPCY